ncbi:putative RNA methyltransferase [Corynebacterium glaucum]|uniref:class I SAM-dependent RNA methyltransferase n=1 Tax=Corynebacterium glaucum TaxID=187491 RepID=UPI0025B3CC6E|nr:TRAM domain-containing protein [Corynebacterium glaucum]WJZ07890.1 putative RNA methyltransferase [Corynebacterium glaucum]
MPSASPLLTLKIDRIAHGGDGIGTDADGRVVFVRGAVPGDTVLAHVTQAKKRWARAELDEIVSVSDLRVPHACPAAAAGAGCCDYSHIDPAAQLGLKLEVLAGQLRSLAKGSSVFDGTVFEPLEPFEPGLESAIETIGLQPHQGWRTRVRLGVDAEGRAGVRRARSNDVVASEQCTQPVEGLLDGLVGEQRFTPGSEVVAVRDSEAARHVVEIARSPRGRRAEIATTVKEGSGEVVEHLESPAGHHAFRFPATAFWQAHKAAPQHYADVIREWGAANYSRETAWDLYGGVGAFVPAIHAATGGSRIHTVDSSAAATSETQDALAGMSVEVHQGRVEGAVDKLEAPGLVVLDPPRAGAGETVVSAVAAASPERVIHIGCDPATLARDLAAWGRGGYAVSRMMLVDAFPATHHFETLVLLEPRAPKR